MVLTERHRTVLGLAIGVCAVIAAVLALTFWSQHRDQARVDKVARDNATLRAYVDQALAAQKSGLPIPAPPPGVQVIAGQPGQQGQPGQPGRDAPCITTPTTTPPGGPCAGAPGAGGAAGAAGAGGAAGAAGKDGKDGTNGTNATVPVDQTRVEHFPDGSVETCSSTDSAMTWSCEQTSPPTTTTTTVPPATTTTLFPPIT